MNRNVAFTICAKNYLAQAFTLKESFEIHNPNCDFFIFLSDDSEGIADSVITLEDSWIPDWKKMAFKYNVIEFSTSVKPFCFKKLFQENYDKIIYLDPDIYVTNPLDEIFDFLENKTIVLTPHYCNIQTEYTGSITEEEILFVGIYNLGFTAIKNNLIGLKIIDWWMNRLSNKCYADKIDALHVDQKWMDFIPAFFPNDVLITHHMGINPAIWNLHER
jgi:lipopolysaccharide biosynthesis glycosyltransferase